MTLGKLWIPRFLKRALVWILALVLMAGHASAWAQDATLAKLQALTFNPAGPLITLTAQSGYAWRGDYAITRVTEPDRLVIDLPSTLINTTARTIPLHQAGVDRIELTQSLGAYYQVVRLTVFVTDTNLMKSVFVKPSGNVLTIAMGQNSVAEQAGPTQSLSANPIVPNPTAKPLPKNVLSSLTINNGTLRLEGTPGSSLVVKNRFTLPNPNRLVVDLGETRLAGRALARPIDVPNNPLIQSVKIGQFDESTVRVVLQSPKPGQIYVVYPNADKRTVEISTSANASLETLPAADQDAGLVQDIQLTRGTGKLELTLKTTQPMVRSITRNGNIIEISLVNISARDAMVAFDPDQFPEVREIKLQPLSATEPNSKVLITLNNPALQMDQALSADSKTLTLSLLGSAGGNNNPNGLLLGPDTPLPLKKGTYTVVVDAGHGGKDLGANRNGVNEKDLNLSVALKLKKALEAKGITVVMTRSSDVFLPLPQICAITNRVKPDAFISVHTNASVNNSINGVETYFYTPQSREYAHIVHRRAINAISAPDRGVRTAMFYVVHHTAVPAILFEMGYISNTTERTALQTAARQQATAEALAQGVASFLSGK